MKKDFVVLCALLTSSVFAIEMQVVDTAKEVKLELDFGIHSSMCGMNVTSLKVNAPRDLPFGLDLPSKGEIELTVDRNNGICLTAFGPERATVTFQKGQQLPELQAGVYSVEVNDEQVGEVVVK
jgi:hypothetical protein